MLLLKYRFVLILLFLSFLSLEYARPYWGAVLSLVDSEGIVAYYAYHVNSMFFHPLTYIFYKNFESDII